MGSDTLYKSGYADRIPAGLVVLGVAIGLSQVGSHLLLSGLGSLSIPTTYLSFGITGAFALLVVSGGYWLRTGPVSPERYRRVAAWCLGLTGGFLAINLLLIAAWPAGSFAENLSWALFAASVGAGGGTLFGTIEARTIERAVRAERASIDAEYLESQREWLEYLNGLLRHEVLNTTNIIVGYAELLLEDEAVDAGTRDRLERIDAQSRKLTEVIQDVRLLIEASKERPEYQPVDVVSLLREQVAALEARHECVVVETDLPDHAYAAADDLLGRALSNVLQNAVHHNDAAVQHVHVGCSVGADAVRVEIADDGPGVPEDIREQLFERSVGGDHGLGLYLVRTLLERYDGSVALASTGPDGSTFAITLPRASAEPPSAEPAATPTPNRA